MYKNMKDFFFIQGRLNKSKPPWSVSLQPPYPKASSSDGGTASALQGEFILFSSFYLICLSDSFALSDSQRVQGDAKLPDQRRRHVAGRKWDTAQRCKQRERRLLPHAYQACRLSFCSPVFQRSGRSTAAWTASTFRKEKPDSKAESRLTPWS